MLTFDKVKAIVLDELHAKGYAPNPSDVTGLVARIMDLSEEPATVPSAPTVPVPVAAVTTPPKV